MARGLMRRFSESHDSRLHLIFATIIIHVMLYGESTLYPPLYRYPESESEPESDIHIFSRSSALGAGAVIGAVGDGKLSTDAVIKEGCRGADVASDRTGPSLGGRMLPLTTYTPRGTPCSLATGPSATSTASSPAVVVDVRDGSF